LQPVLLEEHPDRRQPVLGEQLDPDTYGKVETELDEQAARAANKKGDDALAASASILPLDPLPNILLTSTKIVGPVADNPIQGPFWTMWGWGLTR